MEIEISAQAAAFLCAGLLGALLGLLYDLLRALRTLWKGRGTALTDGLYSLVVLVSVFYFAMAFGQGAAADLHGVGHPGRCRLVFLPAEPSSAPIVGLLAGQPPADPAHPALSGSFSLAAAKKTFAPVQKMLPFLQNLVYNRIIALPWGSIPKLAGQEMEGAQ